MSLSRRDALRLGFTGGVVAGLAGCAPLAARIEGAAEVPPLPAGNFDETVRLLGRLGFGHRPQDLAAARRMGAKALIDQALAAESEEPLALRLQLQRLDVLQLEAADLFDLPEGEVMRQLQQAGILRAVYGANGLLERMVDFWSNHFNVYAPKEDGTFFKGRDEALVVRRHALGSFYELVSASAHSPAMLTYLDNGKNERAGPNENYARELMELHTLGVDGGYTQRDVREVARCFTGWGVEDRFLRPRGRFRFDPERHDDGAKRVLGAIIPPGGGQADGERVLEILATHPATARHIARKLCEAFTGAQDPATVSRAAAAFLKSKGDIRASLRPVLESPELLDGPPILKRPFDYLVSCIRATGGRTDGGSAIQAHLTRMGEALYLWPMPDGYPTRASAWTGSMLPRWNFALAYATGKLSGTPSPKIERPLEATLGRRARPEDGPLVEAVAGASPELALALCLGSPDFQWR